LQPEHHSDTKPKRAKNGAHRYRKPRAIADWNRATLQNLDRRTAPFLRYEQLRHGIISDLGGEDAVSVAQSQIADRCAFISMKLEMMQVADLAGTEPLDLQRFGELVDRGRRSFESIGLQRVPRDVTTLTEFISDIEAQKQARADSEMASDALNGAATTAEPQDTPNQEIDNENGP